MDEGSLLETNRRRMVALLTTLAPTQGMAPSLLEGVKRLKGGTMTTESVVMRASSGTVRWVKGEHRKPR